MSMFANTQSLILSLSGIFDINLMQRWWTCSSQKHSS